MEEVEEIEVQKLKSSRVQEFKSLEKQELNAEGAEDAEEENPRPTLKQRGWGTRRERQTQEQRD